MENLCKGFCFRRRINTIHSFSRVIQLYSLFPSSKPLIWVPSKCLLKCFFFSALGKESGPQASDPYDLIAIAKEVGGRYKTLLSIVDN